MTGRRGNPFNFLLLPYLLLFLAFLFSRVFGFLCMIGIWFLWYDWSWSVAHRNPLTRSWEPARASCRASRPSPAPP